MKPTISLTFDDGLPVQRLYALPELDKRAIPATFFLIGQSEYNDDQFRDFWRAAAGQGHEIGSHSISHRKAASLTPIEMENETRSSKIMLQASLGVSVESFCYPYTDAPAPLQQAVGRAGYRQARGGRVARPDKFYVPGDGGNLLNTTCFHVGPETIKDFPKWVSETIMRKAWLTLMFHGVGPDRSQWDNISTVEFIGLLDGLLLAQKEYGLEIKTYAQGAEAYRRG